MPHISYTSPVGPLSLFQQDEALVALDWGWPPSEDITPLLEDAREQLDGYFRGILQTFTIPLKLYGSDFQVKVWQALSDIPWGQVETYGEFAARLKTSPRAVGGALGRNPLPILIPCHRIISSDRSLGGYSGWDGVDTKRSLLKLEGIQL